MRTERIAILALTVAMGIGHVGPASAAGVGEIIGKVGTAAKRFFSRGASEAAEETAVKTASSADLNASRTVKDILYFKDKLQEDTLGLFKDIKVRVTSGHYFPTLNRSKAVDETVILLNSTDTELIALEGAEGVGKSQIPIGVQERIQLGNVPDQLRNAKFVEMDSGHLMMSDLKQVESQLDTLVAQSPKDKDGMVILTLANPGYFLTESAMKSRMFDAFVELAQRKVGKDRLKIMIEGNESIIKSLGESSKAIKGMARVSVDSMNTFEIEQVAAKLAERLQKESGMTIGQEALEKASQWSEMFLGHIGAPKSVVKLILGARSFREQMIHATESPLTTELRTVVKGLEDELAKLTKLDGAYARERAAEIPGLLTAKRAQIKEMDERFVNLKAAIKEKDEIAEKIAKARKEGRGAESDPAMNERLKTLIGQINEISVDELALWIKRETGKPVEEIMQKEWTMAEALKEFKDNLFGQDHLFAPGIMAAERARAAFRTGDAPTSILLVGPPGVGKTEFAKILGRIAGYLARFDGSDFSQAHAIARIIGTFPGYIGFDPAKTGELIEKLLKHPRGNYLFDEIDMFHADFTKLFYPFLSDGRITGGTGKLAMGTEACVTMTTNVGYKKVNPQTPRKQVEKVLYEDSGGKLTEAMLNRVDEIIVMNDLDEAISRMVIGKELGLLKKAMAKKYRGLKVSDEVLDFLVQEMKGKELNPRDISRMVRKLITDQANRTMQQGFWRNAQGVDVPLKFVEGDMLEVTMVKVGERTQMAFGVRL